MLRVRAIQHTYILSTVYLSMLFYASYSYVSFLDQAWNQNCFMLFYPQLGQGKGPLCVFTEELSSSWVNQLESKWIEMVTSPNLIPMNTPFIVVLVYDGLCSSSLHWRIGRNF